MPKRKLLAAGRGLPCAARRAAVEETIERLIGLLDAIDGDADLEASLGWPGGDDQTALAGEPAGAAVDAELDEADLEDSDEDDDHEDEASLGAPAGDGNQTRSAQGQSSDLELTGTIDDIPTWPVGRTPVESMKLRVLEREAIALAARLRRKKRAARPSRYAARTGG